MSPFSCQSQVTPDSQILATALMFTSIDSGQLFQRDLREGVLGTDQDHWRKTLSRAVQTASRDFDAERQILKYPAKRHRVYRPQLASHDSDIRHSVVKACHRGVWAMQLSLEMHFRVIFFEALLPFLHQGGHAIIPPQADRLRRLPRGTCLSS